MPSTLALAENISFFSGLSFWCKLERFGNQEHHGGGHMCCEVGVSPVLGVKAEKGFFDTILSVLNSYKDCNF